MISFSENLRFIPGMVRGLQQSGLAGRMSVTDCAGLALDRLDELMADFFPVSPDTLEATEPPQVLLAHKILLWTIGIQQHARIIVSNRYYLGNSKPGDDGSMEFAFVLPFSIPTEASRACFEWLDSVITDFHKVYGDPGEDEVHRFRTDFDELQQTLSQFAAASVNRYAIAEAAFTMDIPIRPLRSDTYCVGVGCHTRLVSSSLTDATPAIGTRIAGNKIFCAELLRSAGFPAPVHALAKDPQQAVEIANRLGYPVVVKPADQEEGRGVSSGLERDEEVRAAFARASQVSRNILVEKHVEGDTHRLTVFKDQVIKAVRRIAGGVIGDGERSVAQLVEQEQQDERLQRISQRHGGPVLSLDEEALELLALEQLTPESVPEAGRRIRLRRRDNASAGGRNETLQVDEVHPDNRLLAIRAARLLRLDFAGIDLITTDVRRSWLEVGGLICEVNAQPTLGVSDSPRIYQEILIDLLPEGSRIPVHLAIVFPSIDTSLKRLAELAEQLSCRSMSCKQGLWLDNTRIAASFANHFVAARAMLNSLDTHSALCIMEAEEIVQYGLPLDRFDALHLCGNDRCSAEESKLLRAAMELIEDQVGSIHNIND